MDTSKNLSRLILISTLLVLASSIALGIYTQTSKSQNKQTTHGHTYQPATVTSAPEVKSKVKGIEISGVTLINQGTPQAAIQIDVTNNRDEAVMALDFVSGKDDSSALGIDGLLEEGKPIVAIQPHSLKTFTWFLGEIMEGQTVYLASVVFADGKEEGDKRSLDGMKAQRRHFQQNQRAAKAKTGGQN